MVPVLLMPVPLVLDIVMIPPEVLVRVPKLVMAPKLVRVPKLIKNAPLLMVMVWDAGRMTLTPGDIPMSANVVTVRPLPSVQVLVASSHVPPKSGSQLTASMVVRIFDA